MYTPGHHPNNQGPNNKLINNTHGKPGNEITVKKPQSVSLLQVNLTFRISI